MVARNLRFKPTGAEIDSILAAPSRFTAAMNSVEFAEAEHDLSARMEAAKPDILAAVQIDNVNIRGNAIERLIAGEATTHELGDEVRPFGGGELVIDVKTKLLDRASAPKASNVDKVLRLLTRPDSVLAFFKVGVDAKRGRVLGRLLTVLDDALIESVKGPEALGRARFSWRDAAVRQTLASRVRRNVRSRDQRRCGTALSAGPD